MIAVLCTFLALLAVPSHEQDFQDSTPISPCPNVFTYEPPGSEPGWWSGVVILSTDSLLHSLWLNIVLDTKAIKLRNWVGEVTTRDGLDFRIENSSMQIHPGLAVSVRFSVQYDPLNQIPRLQAIRLNGRVICNANTGQPTVINSQVLGQTNTGQLDQRPKTSSDPNRKPDRNLPWESSNPVHQRPLNNPNDAIYEEPKDILKLAYEAVATPTPNLWTTWSPDNPNIHNDYDNPIAYDYRGYPVTSDPPNTTTETTSEKIQCGKSTLESQWPWRVAIYKTKKVNYQYHCGGTLVSHRHVITGAQCVHTPTTKIPVNVNTLMVYLGKHNLRTSVRGVQIGFVQKITVHPDYNVTYFTHDMAILELQERVAYTDWVGPACLWPDNQSDLTNVIGERGWLVGWGFDEENETTEEPSQVEMPVVDHETCISSLPAFFGKFITPTSNNYCAGNRDEAASCKGANAGGGMVFRRGDTWYLRGFVSIALRRFVMMKGQCDPTNYFLFTDLAKYLPWIRQIVSDF